jgi:hypothetical protein
VPPNEKPWKKLAAELREHGVESRYLPRIEARVTPEDQLEQLERELAQEMAAALGRTEDRLNFALAELELSRARYDRAVASAAPEAERHALCEAFNSQRAHAEKRLRDLLIQREAMGFRRNQILNELYPIPPRLRPT